ncbi:MAG TPA: hypothetical protein DD381_01615 [Lentisphaeria bacterium]|nr:MAG: hypothetical protein A2X47_10415 [Lentisphaerae bacterium GWF2_38_69]HBM15039.1 hypothetical protein [Lentisphaeria bacterium]
MNNEEIKKVNIQELVFEIERHNRLYWKINKPEISDEEYDALIEKLRELDPENPFLEAVESSEVASLGKVVLNKPMISLDKTYFFKEAPKGKKSLLKWASEIIRSEEEIFLIQPKYDGISASYSNGILATRGQGTEDENVTDKIPLIELESKKYKGPLDRPVRGEIIIRNDDFKIIYSRIKKSDGSCYKNPRNAVAGIMGLKDIRQMLAQKAKLTLIDYDMISYSTAYKEIERKWTELLKEIESLPYPMDGIVIKLADKNYSESLGETAHHPRGQIAFKFSGVRKKTKLIGVEWSFGKNCLTPVAKIEPVEIGGVTICNVTLHNLANVEEKDIQIGDIVTVERAGDVIPHIVESEDGEERRNCIIFDCPSCHSKLYRNDKELQCINPNCFETNLQRLLASIRNIGIEELGEPTVRKMMNILKVKTLADIFRLTVPDILKLEGFKEKSASNLFKSIQVAKKTTDYKLLASLNINGIGQTSAKALLNKYTLDELKYLTIEQLQEIKQVGPTLSVSIYNFFKEKSEVLNELVQILNLLQTKGSSETSEQKTICFTGEMPEKRSYYEKLAEAQGFKAVSSVTKQLSLLVTSDKDSNSSKTQKSKSLGIEILSLEEWLDSLKENNADKENLDNDGLLPGF